MFQFSFVFCTFIKLFHKAETPLGENFFKQKKNNRSCETDKVRKLSKHKHVAFKQMRHDTGLSYI